MELEALQRRTVDEDPEALASAQVFVQGRVVWHDLHFAHAAVAGVGGNPNKYQWLQQCQQFWASADVTHPHIHIRTRSTPSHLISNICDSFALHTLLWILCERGRISAVTTLCAAFLRHGCRRIEDCVVQDTVVLAELEGRPCLNAGPVRRLYLHRGKHVTGWASAISHGLQSQLAETVVATWTSMYAEKHLRDPFESATHQLTDILHFTLFCAPTRKSLGLKMRPAMQRLLNCLWGGVNTSLGLPH